MSKVIHRSDKRGVAEHGWLNSRHSFSFSEFYDPEKISFSLLRVLNDDVDNITVEVLKDSRFLIIEVPMS